MLSGDNRVENNITSEDNDMMFCCANCGIAEVDDIKLKKCDDCDLVKYCSVKCQREHRPKHKRACKKRAAELRDELLFKQPESTHLGDCPICFLPLPSDQSKSAIHFCCSKRVCNGCIYANCVRMNEEMLDPNTMGTCPFCREPTAETDEERNKRRMKRIAVNDPFAIQCEGGDQYQKGDYSGSFKYISKAAKLGDTEAQFLLSALYQRGHGVEKDMGKAMYHLEEAAIGGHSIARNNLACEEINNRNYEKGVKHFIIAATQGEDNSTKALMDLFKRGFVSKEDLASALRAHQTAVDATKSPHREAVDGYLSRRGIR